MPIDIPTLAKVVDEAITTDADTAIENYGAALSDEEKAAIRGMNKDQLRDTLKSLKDADHNLNQLLFVDTNNNNVV